MIEIIIDGGVATMLYQGQEEFLGEVSTEWLNNYVSNLRNDGFTVEIDYIS
jgi:hypothetical protein